MDSVDPSSMRPVRVENDLRVTSWSWPLATACTSSQLMPVTVSGNSSPTTTQITLASLDYSRDPPGFAGASSSAFVREDVIAAGQPDQFRYPLDAGDERIIPFLEVDAWPDWQPRGCMFDLFEVVLERQGIGVGEIGCADHAA